jgi:hypothetical protein
MKIDLFNWSIGTAIISSILFFVLGLFTTNDLYHLITLVAIALLSIIIFSRKYPQLSSFKSGGIIGVVVFVSLYMTGNVRGRIEDLGWTYLILLITFFVAGYIGKISIKK